MVYSLKELIKMLTVVFFNMGGQLVSWKMNVSWLSDLKRSREGEHFQ